MKSILFVCHGNICRSPMAEFIFKDMLQKVGREQEFYVESAATSREEIWGNIGNPVYPPAKAELARHGISCEGKRARQIVAEDYTRFDYIYVMDGNNLRNALRIFGNDTEGKVQLLMNLCGQNRDVADPWYTGDFSTAYEDIALACSILLKN